MLTAEGCRARRERLWQRLDPAAFGDRLCLTDPIHLSYFAGFTIDPVSLATNTGACLLLARGGKSTLLAGDRAKKAVADSHADECVVVPWYDGQHPGRGPRQTCWADAARKAGWDGRVHDRLGDSFAEVLVGTLADLRRAKDPDEVELLRRCMRATEAGHSWARQNIRPGMTELDVYCGVSGACIQTAGQPVVVYGDFAVATDPDHRGGGPTARVLQPGDTFILDYSVVIGGYRSDFTNTLVVGKEPAPDQQQLCDLSKQAMAAGEKELRAGQACKTVYDAVRGVFEAAGVADAFPHHAGHGLGLTHPENPYIVRHADETLRAGDVVTLEPGLYVAGVGGIRIEHNYLVTDAGYERLSNHEIALR